MINLDSTLFNIDISTQEPSPGRLLVAEPFLGESYFNHSVIILIDYKKGESSMGLVLNRKTNFTIGQLIEGFDEELDYPIYCGGPMSPNRLFYIHRLGNIIANSQRIGDDLWIGGDYDALKEYIRCNELPKNNIRFFIGYSGWDKNQLENEIREHVWAVTNQLSAHSMLRGAENAYWHKVVRSMGDKYRSWLLHPMNPSSN